MPRPNKPRVVAHEATVARRIRHEREARNLTYERLAQKMTEAGCAIQGSAIFKIENGDPPRRITLNEAITFAQVFGLKLSALLTPVEVAASREALELWKKYGEARQQVRSWEAEADKLEGRLVDLSEGNEAVMEALRDADPTAELLVSAERTLRRMRHMIEQAEQEQGD